MEKLLPGVIRQKKARGETASTPEARIADFRAKIARKKRLLPEKIICHSTIWKPVLMKSQNKGTAFRKWSRIIHRDLSFLLCGNDFDLCYFGYRDEP